MEELVNRATTDFSRVDDLYFAHLLSKSKSGKGLSFSTETRDRLLKNLNRTSLAYAEEDE